MQQVARSKQLEEPRIAELIGSMKFLVGNSDLKMKNIKPYFAENNLSSKIMWKRNQPYYLIDLLID